MLRQAQHDKRESSIGSETMEPESKKHMKRSLIIFGVILVAMVIYGAGKALILNKAIDLDHGYTQSYENIYYYGEKISGIDIKSFIVLDDSYAKDDEHIYFEGELIEGTTPPAFYWLSPDYMKDGLSVFYTTKKIEGSDSETFELLESTFAKDKNRVYYLATVIEGANPATFEVLNDVYAKDKDNVYYVWFEESDFEHDGKSSFDIRVEGADRDSFEVSEEEYSLEARDKNFSYSEGIIVNE